MFGPAEFCPYLKLRLIEPQISATLAIQQMVGRSQIGF